MNDRQRLTRDGKMIVRDESGAVVNRVRQGVTPRRSLKAEIAAEVLGSAADTIRRRSSS